MTRPSPMPELAMLSVPQKAYRAGVIAAWMERAGYQDAVCFTCGRAAHELRNAGVNVLEVGPRGGLAALRWWTPAEIHRAWPGYFDATPGHLPMHLMVETARIIRRGEPEPTPGEYVVPSGSGETIMCLKIAWPTLHLSPAFEVPGLEAETRYEPEAPLVEAIAGVVG